MKGNPKLNRAGVDHERIEFPKRFSTFRVRGKLPLRES
jgi:hypothetical protein